MLLTLLLVPRRDIYFGEMALLAIHEASKSIDRSKQRAIPSPGSWLTTQAYCSPAMDAEYLCEHSPKAAGQY